MNPTKNDTRQSIGALVGALLFSALIGTIVVALPLFSAHAEGEGHSAHVSLIPRNDASYEPGELIVTLADAGTEGGRVGAIERAIESTGSRVSGVLLHASRDTATTLLVSTPNDKRSGEGLGLAAQAIAALEGVSAVQPNYRYATAANAADIARDEDVAKQYYLNDWETAHGVNAAAAWGKVDGSRKVDVAVLDTGIYVMPEYDGDARLRTGSTDGFDISENFHQEFDASNLDLADGADFVHAEQDGEPLPLVNDHNPFGDDNGHGTHVSGIIAAGAQTAGSPNMRAAGMAGVSQSARIIPVKVLNSAGEGSTADFIRAYDYLLQKKRAGVLPNLHVINLSFALMAPRESGDGGALDDDGSDDVEIDTETVWDDQTGLPDPGDEDNTDGDESADVEDSRFQEMIRAAQQLGIVTVCAVGNREADGVVYDSYPSAFEECIGVTAIDETGSDVAFANNNGDEDIAAPGVGIYSTWASQADAYVALDGTSQATAIVSGVLSLLWASNSNLTVDQVKDAVFNTAHEVPQGTLATQGAHGVQDAQDDQDAMEAPRAQESPESPIAPSAERRESSATGQVAETAKAQTYTRGHVPDVSSNAAGLTAQAKRHYAIDAAAALDYLGSGLKPPQPSSSSSSPSSSSSASSSSSSEGATEKTVYDLSKASVTLPKTSYTYTGKLKKPAVTVKVGGKKVAASNYTVTYKNNKKVGTATVTVKAAGSQARGKASVKFKIVPKGTAFKKLVPGVRGFTATWKKQAKQTSGYQLRYSLKKNMASAKKKTISKTKTVKLKVGKLKKGKTYYVQVRTYKKVGKANYYSKWSAKKRVKVK